MRSRRRKEGSTRIIVLPALILACCVLCSAQRQSPESLILSLTHEADPPGTRYGQSGSTRVWEYETATALASWGEAALPEIEKRLDAAEKGKNIYNLDWLELAYARIRGPNAFERLRRIELNPRLGSDDFYGNDERESTDTAIALSLRLTSFVSAPLDGGHLHSSTKFHWSSDEHGEEPREALEMVIKAFERNDETTLQRRLGSDANAALAALLKGKTFSQLRAELLPNAKALDDFAMAFRFAVVGLWSEPPMMLTEHTSYPEGPPVTVLYTRFMTRSGVDCGEHNVDFVLTHNDREYWQPYLVNNSNLADLLRIIASCAVRD